MLEEVFSKTVGQSSGPDIPLFMQFKAFWPNIVFTDYKPGTMSRIDSLQRALPICLMTKTFVTEQLGMSHQREDYHELLELAPIFIGGVQTCVLLFRKPGAIHYAHFTSWLICALQTYGFWDAGLKMTGRELHDLGDFCVFGVTAFVRSWFLCPLPSAALANDLSSKNFSPHLDHQHLSVC